MVSHETFLDLAITRKYIFQQCSKSKHTSKKERLDERKKTTFWNGLTRVQKTENMWAEKGCGPISQVFFFIYRVFCF